MVRRSSEFRLALLGVAGTLAAMVLVSCRTSPLPDYSVIRRTRPDGEVVSCRHPPAAWFDTDDAVGMAAAFPDLVQAMESSESVDEKVDRVLEAVDSLKTLEVLDYRLCLEYGSGTLSEHAHEEWVGTVYPRAVESLERRTASLRWAGPTVGLGRDNLGKPRVPGEGTVFNRLPVSPQVMRLTGSAPCRPLLTKREPCQPEIP